MKCLLRLAVLCLPTLAAAAGDEPMNVLGSATAPVAIVEFSDIECPHCGRYERDTFPEIRRNYVDTGKVRYAVVDFPLAMHRHALPAAVAVRCAGRQGHYWDYRAALYADQSALKDSPYDALARRFGLDLATFDACRRDPATTQEVLEGIDRARASGITSTPSFLVGREVDGRFVYDKFSGAKPYADFVAAIEAQLAAAAAQNISDGPDSDGAAPPRDSM
jgi:protein-disulfide isomerase